MHFVFGGAFNGKRKWVKENVLNESSYLWISAYEGTPKSWMDAHLYQDVTVIEGIEQFIYQLLDVPDWKEAWGDMLRKWELFEKEGLDRKLILVGTDITKGVVPVDEKDRLWRDVTGWCYQDLVKKAKMVDVIWYGIHERLKEERE